MKHVAFSFVDPKIVFTQKVFVFALHSNADFALLQSRVHDCWARHRASFRGETLSYSVTACFDSFCFPECSEVDAEKLEVIGGAVAAIRYEVMAEKNLGLTELYNVLTDPECCDNRLLELRGLHEEMDRAVLGAYGWSDIELPPYCPMNPDEKSATAVFTDEVVGRLYVLNAELAAEEERQRAVETTTKKRTSDTNSDRALSLAGMSDSEDLR